MPKACLIFMSLFTFYCSANLLKLANLVKNLPSCAPRLIEQLDDSKGVQRLKTRFLKPKRERKTPRAVTLAQQKGPMASEPIAKPEVIKQEVAQKQACPQDSLEYWCQGENIITLEPKLAEKLIKNSSNKKETAQILINKTKEINKLHEMDPNTISMFLWHNWDQESIDWAMQNYKIKYGWTSIKKIEKK